MKEAIDVYLESEEIKALTSRLHTLFRDDQEGFVRITLPNIKAERDDKLD